MPSNVNFNGVNIGCHAWLEINTENEVEVHKIPRADGAIIRRKGGGLKTLKVHAWQVWNTRAEVEQYMNSLAGNLSSGIGDLIVNGVTYSNCILQDVSSDANHNNFAQFTVTFLKSGD